MKENSQEDELALFRFSLIAPIVNGTLEGTVKKYLERVCAKEHQIPGRGWRELSPNTLRRWVIDYRRMGIKGLTRKSRRDKGRSRILTAKAAKMITDLKTQHPDRNAMAIYRDLINSTDLNYHSVSLSTVQRFLKKLNIGEIPEQERKRFEFEFANECWQTDALVGPYLTIDGKKMVTYLILFLDDASRLVTGARFFFEDNVTNMLSIFKKALLKRGIPKRLFTDQGKIFTSLQLQMICASLGIILSHARPYAPRSKGKIERMFRSLRMQFLEELDLKEITSLEALNEKLNFYLESVYNRRPHCSLNEMAPLDRYFKDQSRLRFVSDIKAFEESFLARVDRKVSQDATLSLNKQIFEVPQKFIGQSVTVLFNPEDLSKAYLREGENLITVYPVRPIDNSKMPRKQNQKQEIDFAGLYGGGTGK